MKVLVTGASGFIGGKLCARLLGDGHSVRALHRRAKLGNEWQALRAAAGDRLEPRRFDLSFPDSMPAEAVVRDCFARARDGVPAALPAWALAESEVGKALGLLEGCEAVVHIAARVGDWGSRREFFEANVNPVAVLLEAARRAGVRRFVYVSSIAVHGFGHHRPGSEDGRYYRCGHPYPLGKRCSERLVLQAMAQGLDACVVRPGNVYGPGDTTTFYPIFDALLKGVMGTLAGGRYLTCPVYIDDMVDALVRALGPIAGTGRVFNVTGGERVTWRRLVDVCCDALGIRRTALDMPGFLARAAAAAMEGAALLVRSRAAPPLTGYRVEQLLHDYQFATQAAERGLGFSPRVKIEEGFAATAAAYRAAGGPRRG